MNTDWYDLLFHTSFTQSYNLSVSGGSDRVNYYISAGYNDQKGVPVEHGEQFPVQVKIHGRVAGRTLVTGMIQFVKYIEFNIRRVIIFCRVFQPFFRGVKIVTSVLVVGGNSPGSFVCVLV